MTSLPTFLGNEPYPPQRNDWERLAATARRLLDQRETGYPQLVADGKLTRADADRGLRVMRAIVEQWRRVDRHEDLPPPIDYPRALGATWAEMAQELTRVAARAADIASKRPDDGAAAKQARLTAALAWHEQPTDPQCAFPHIALAHDYAQWERRRAAGQGRDAA